MRVKKPVGGVCRSVETSATVRCWEEAGEWIG